MLKRTTLICTLVLLMFNLTACKDNKQVKSTDSQNVVESTLNEKEEREAENESNIITDNLLEYPVDIDLFENKDFTGRLKAIAKEHYDEIIANFQTQTPIVSDADVYKLTGCKEHDCPGFHTTILYDAKKDNYNIIVNQNGKVKVYDEKGKITMTKRLKAK